jgi:hypothetical protein
MSSLVTTNMDTLRQGLEQRNAELLIAMYADNAVVQVVDKNHQPSSPLILRGKQAIAEFFRDVCSRDMTHQVTDEVVGKDRISFNEASQYASGERVLSASVLDFQNGKIVRQVIVLAWDE